MPKTLALFDFDGTLTSKDTFLEIIKFAKGKLSFYVGFAILMPVLILFKLKIIANWRAKEIVINYFFGSTNIDDFHIVCEKFCHDKVPSLLKDEAVDKLNYHINEGHDVYIVSASIGDWIRPWSTLLNLKLIATELEVKDHKITGKIKGKNCHGPEKTARIRSEIMLENYTDIYAYGDSSGDKEMLAIATQPFFRRYN